MREHRTWFGWLRGVFLSAAVVLALPAVAGTEAAQKLVEENTNEMLTILKQNRERIKTDPAFLTASVERVIVPNLDFESMTKLAVAAYWRRATPAQRQALVDEFKALLLRTYTKSLAEFSNQEVEFLPHRESGRDDRAVVRSRIIQANGGPPLGVEYRLRRLDEGWKIYDIIIDNVSLVTSYRSSFATEIRQSGLDGLIASLAQKNTPKSE